MTAILAVTDVTVMTEACEIPSFRWRGYQPLELRCAGPPLAGADGLLTPPDM